MLSRRLLALSGFVAAICAYLIFGEDDDRFLIPMAIAIAIGILTYVSQYQLNWWWYQKFPPRLPSEIRQMYMKTGEFFAKLDDLGKQKFGSRVRLFVEAKNFISKGENDPPEDFKYMVAYAAILLTYHQDEYLFKGYDRIVFYPHPFLSPKHPEDVHICEVEHEDGTIILSDQHLVHSFFEPKKFYPVALHCIAESFDRIYLKGTVIDFPQDIFSKLEDVSQIPMKKLEDYIGLEQRYPLPMVVTMYFNYPDRFRSILPELAKKLDDILGS